MAMVPTGFPAYGRASREKRELGAAPIATKLTRELDQGIPLRINRAKTGEAQAEASEIRILLSATL